MLHRGNYWGIHLPTVTNNNYKSKPMDSKNPKIIPVAFSPEQEITPAVAHVRATQDRLWGKDWRKKSVLVAAHALGGNMIKFHYR